MAEPRLALLEIGHGRPSCLLGAIKFFKDHSNRPPPELVWPSAGISRQAPRDVSWPSQRLWLQAGLEGVVGVLEPGFKSGAGLVPKGSEAQF